MVPGKQKLVPIRAGNFGLRYSSDRDHARHGWLVKDGVTVNSVLQFAYDYLLERDLQCVPLIVVNHRGEEVERADFEIEE